MKNSKVRISIITIDNIHQDWVFKVASIIQKNNINFYHVLSDYDLNHTGFVTPDDIKLAFIKLQINLTNSDFDAMLNYFNFKNSERISIKEFSRNFHPSI